MILYRWVGLVVQIPHKRIENRHYNIKKICTYTICMFKRSTNSKCMQITKALCISMADLEL